MSLEGKVAVITGAARGIGYAVARRFLDEGTKVVLADIDDKTGPAVAEDLANRGEIFFSHCDVGERLDVRNMIAATLDTFGEIDILINNAGIVHAADFLAIDEADFDRVLRTNLKGHFLCGQAVARRMVKRVEAGEKPGTIVNMSSINAVVAIADQVPYSVSKGGIDQLTKVMALALAPYGIRVNAIGPGSIMTDMLAAVNDDRSARDKLLSRTPLRRIGEPHEVAAAVAFLASDDASYITGQTLYIDGGRLGLNYTVPLPDED